MYLSEYNYTVANNRLEQAFRESGFKKIDEKSLSKSLYKWQKNTRYQAEKNIEHTESAKKWQFWRSPDTVMAYISYVPPQYMVISSKLTEAILKTDSLDFSPLFYHYFSHYERGHLRNRSESTLASQFGGISAVLAIQYQTDEYIREMILRNGSGSHSSPIFPFSIEDEAQAEWLASKAWKSGRKDTLEITSSWRRISPEFSWAEDYLQIHIGKTKMSN
ncbi:hypothetical protein EP331_04860 [bacterium]|nr:MAG: hypothetical protein EP331_04860 [bacterium]